MEEVYRKSRSRGTRRWFQSASVAFRLEQICASSAHSGLIRIGLILASLVCLGVSLYLYWDYRDYSSDIVLQRVSSQDVKASVSESSSSARLIFVDISGAVESPGMYTIDDGSRISHVIDKAGGIDEMADLSWVQQSLNLAALVVDGQKVYIPFEGELESDKLASSVVDVHSIGATEIGQPTKIAINTANQEELESLPGIGSTTAAKIIEFREVHDGFDRLEDIMDVSGIGISTFDDIKEFIQL